MIKRSQQAVFHLCITLVIFLFSSNIQAQDNECERHYSIVWENDAIVRDDGGYTNGFAYNWGYKSTHCGNSWAQQLNSWLARLSLFHGQENEGMSSPYSYQLAHAIFTPSDIKESEIIPDDRPYTGLMYGALNFYHHDEQSATHYELLFGAVGPITQAEEIQKFIHEIIGTDTPNGWDNQTRNEPVFRLGVDKNWKLYSGSFLQRYESDIIGMSDVKAGNLSSDIGAGLSYRIGSGLSNSFPYHSIVPGRSIPSLMLKPGDWGVFFTLYGNYVFNDITIEGNTHKDSHGVPLTHEQLRYVIAGYYQLKNYGLSASIQQSSEQFEDADENTVFLTLGLSY